MKIISRSLEQIENGSSNHLSRMLTLAVLLVISMSIFSTHAYAYKTEKDCEAHEGTGKCCDLGPQQGGGRHWGVCSYKIAVMDNPDAWVVNAQKEYDYYEAEAVKAAADAKSAKADAAKADPANAKAAKAKADKCEAEAVKATADAKRAKAEVAKAEAAKKAKADKAKTSPK